MTQIVLRDAEQAFEVRDEVMHVWHDVFGEVEDIQEWRDTVFDRHRARADYRLATAHDDNQIVGFSWGYTGQPGQFWSDYIVEKLGQTVDGWVGGHFEFVELAVLPAWRRQHIGGRLHDALLEGLSHDRALLGTSDDPDSPAVKLYLSRGWRQLGRQSESDQVMGMRLRAFPYRPAGKSNISTPL